MYADAQTHVLPTDNLQRLSMALAMHYDDWDALSAAITMHRQRVHDYYNNTVAVPQLAETNTVTDPFARIWRGDVSAEEASAIFVTHGINNGDILLQQLSGFRALTVIQALTGSARQRLDKLMPQLLLALRHAKIPVEALPRLLNLIQSIARRSVYLALLIEYPVALEQVVRLCAASPWISHLLTHYPVLLDELLDARALYEIPTREQMAQELTHRVQSVTDDEERLLDNLRKFKQAQMLRVAAVDQAAVLDVFAVSGQLTLLAEVLLDKVYELAWQHLVARYGRPTCMIDSRAHYPTLAVLGYGKMGGRELGYGSDLDLVFLHDSSGESQHTDGENAVDNAVFFARLAQRMMYLMATRTGTGRLYEVDTQLRPDGAAGMLVSSFEAFEHYQLEQAWTWEHQALTRARLVVGNAHLAGEFDRIRRAVLMRQREPAQLRQDILDMRQKMRVNLATKDRPRAEQQPEVFDIKQDAGGMIDIEFIAQYGVLVNAAKQAPLLEHKATRQVLHSLHQLGWLNTSQADVLCTAFEQYRQRSHQLALQEKSSVVDGSEFTTLRQQVQQIWQQIFNI
jgi:[glutamine synthetase] adenylyltransferase / [glutamine synthetase]-adenylyl-L-tyrosine phosphorylase